MRHVDDLHKFVETGIGNDEFEHKAVHLGFGKRISTVLFDRVLCREDEERLRKLSRNAHDRHGMFLHGLQKRGLRLGGRTVDFVGEDDIIEDRPRLEFESRITVFVLDDDICTGDVCGHQIGCELNTGEGQVKHSAERPDKSGFSYAGNPFEKYVSACDHRDNRTFDDGLLTNDVAGNLLKNFVALLAKLFNIFFCNHDFFLVFNFDSGSLLRFSALYYNIIF